MLVCRTGKSRKTSYGHLCSNNVQRVAYRRHLAWRIMAASANITVVSHCAHIACIAFHAIFSAFVCFFAYFSHRKNRRCTRALGAKALCGTAPLRRHSFARMARRCAAGIGRCHRGGAHSASSWAGRRLAKISSHQQQNNNAPSRRRGGAASAYQQRDAAAIMAQRILSLSTRRALGCCAMPARASLQRRAAVMPTLARQHRRIARGAQTHRGGDKRLRAHAARACSRRAVRKHLASFFAHI